MAQQAEDGASTSAAFFSGCREGRQRYTPLEIIGRGSYGTVCSAVDRLTGQKVAIKRIQNVFDNVADAQRILREVMLLRLLKHPDVVEVKHILLPSDPNGFKDLYIVFELMESDLHTVIGANDDLTPDHHRVFLYQLLRGLAFIHEAGVLHRDLKPKNILANSNCKLTICDLGLARPIFADGLQATMLTDYVATRWYRAPELCGCFYGTYTEAVDIWSIGCIFAETLLGKPLFPGRDAVAQLNIITDLLGKPSHQVIEGIGNHKARAFLHAMPHKTGQPFELKFRNADRLGLDLLKHLLAFDPSLRPTAAEALQHPYFDGLPTVAPSNRMPITREQFEFEMHQLTEADVRQLIFVEALHYHPHVRQQYIDNGYRLPPLLSQLEMDDGTGVAHGFQMIDQYGPAAAVAAAAALAAAQAAQQQQQRLHQHQHQHPQASAAAAAAHAQSMAHQLQTDPLMAAAAAAQEQQYALARMQAYEYYQQATQGLAGANAHMPSSSALYQDPGVARILATEC